MKKKSPKELRAILEKSPLYVEKTTIAQAAQVLGQIGGKRGGAARNAVLSSKRKKEIAKMGAAARWRRRPSSQS